ncbi:MAG: tetratricopeptide repeat protein, partial [Acidobacteria bacterium]|nr:tetratricopeptide repeat protein [Acidobacteriota bacterium]
LDPNNPDVFINLADSYLRENQKDEAVEAYAEAGSRFSRQNRHEEAIRALMKGFDLKATDLRILNGLVKAHTAMGRAQKAAHLLEEILDNEPYNRDVLYLLIECCVDSQNAPGAEKAVVKLVEIEPANYPKFLDLIRIYLNISDATSAARILGMSIEHLLAGGQSEECGKWINEILERDPTLLGALRLLVQYNSWLNDETGVRLALERLYTAAADQNSVEEERYALQQLVVIRPHEVRYRDRLTEINDQYGFEDDEHIAPDEVPTADAASEDVPGEPDQAGRVEDLVERNGHIAEAGIVEEAVAAASHTNGHNAPELTLAQSEKLQKELESVAFFVENDYYDLAEKALDELAAEFGEQPEITELRTRMGKEPPEHVEIIEHVDAETAATDVDVEVTANTIGIDEIRSEFGLETDDQFPGDYDTHYQMGVAYQEMGLMEDAIREYQDAINLTQPADGSRRFFQCATLLGHCFLENSKPHHAITWLERALEVPALTDNEQHGIWYEIAIAHEANGEDDRAAEFFERIYAENVDFRDVADRVRSLAEA